MSNEEPEETIYCETCGRDVPEDDYDSDAGECDRCQETRRGEDSSQVEQSSEVEQPSHVEQEQQRAAGNVWRAKAARHAEAVNSGEKSPGGTTASTTDSDSEEDNRGTVIGITACSKSKIGGPGEDIGEVEAQDLYDSWLFDGRVEALKANCDAWCIFSGKYGFLEPEDPVEWYNQRLDDLPIEEQRELAADVAENVAAKGADTVLILMGRTYADRLMEALDDDIEVWDPLEGVQLFDQRGELDALAASGKKGGQTTLDM